MMKSLLVSLFALGGCVTSGLQTLETKYVPGNCTVVTPEYAKEQPELKGIEGLVWAVTATGYHVVFVLPLIGPQDQGAVERDMLDKNSNLVECSETSKKLLPVPQEVE